MRVQSNAFSTSRRPRSPICRAAARCSSRFVSARLTSGTVGSTHHPARHSSIDGHGHPRVTITGSAAAIASPTARPKFSEYEVSAKASALASALLLAARNGAYGLAMSRRMHGGVAKRLLAAHFTLDESTAMASAQPDDRDAEKAFWITGLAVFVFWNLGTLVGALVGDTAARHVGLSGLLFTAALYDLLLAPFVVPGIMALARRTDPDPLAEAGGASQGADISSGWLSSGTGLRIGDQRGALGGLKARARTRSVRVGRIKGVKRL